MCAAPLGEGDQVSERDIESEDPTSRKSNRAEHRWLTIVFCDLVGSTQLSAELEPEELRAIVWSYQNAAVGAIERLGGYVAQYLGDGVLAYFGFPNAHEEDAQRAVRASLELIETISRLGKEVATKHELRVRVGIHTGTVVAGRVGAGRKEETLALGKTPNVAARVQSAADPGQVVISAVTRGIIGREFECESLGFHELKGVDEPTELFRVVARRTDDVSKDSPVGAGLTPLIGRSKELTQLQASFQRANSQGTQAVVIGGDAGLGKSRLVREFLAPLAEQRVGVMRGQGVPYFQNTPFHALARMVGDYLKLDREETGEAKLRKIEQTAVSLGEDPVVDVPLLAMLLGVKHGSKYSLANWPPERLRTETMRLLSRFVAAEGSKRPLVLVVEDLHWADATSLEWLESWIATEHAKPVLVLLTHRPEFVSPWKPSDKLEQINLERISSAGVADMISGITKSKPLPPSLTQRIIERTDGVPIFVEELTKAILETGVVREGPSSYELAGSNPDYALPDTLTASLMARLDRLGDVKELAQLAAVIGREFSYELLAAVAEADRGTLRLQLHALVQSDLLEQAGTAPDATYHFRHALLQEAAHGSLLSSRRRYLHRVIARTLVSEFAETSAPELIAHHYTEAGMPKPAAANWLDAGKLAADRSANKEAIDHLQRGLALLKELPESTERDLMEVTYQTSLGPALIATGAYSADSVEQCYSRAQELCIRTGQVTKLSVALWGLFQFHLVRANLERTLRLGEEMVRLGEAERDDAMLLNGHTALGTTLYFLGQLERADSHLTKAVAFDHSERDRSKAIATGQDVPVVARLLLGQVLCLKGLPDSGLESCTRAVAIARELDHPFSLAFALHWLCLVRQHRGERHQMRDVASELVTLCKEQGIQWWLIFGEMQLSWAALAGASEEDQSAALRVMRNNRELGLSFGATLGASQFFVLEVESLLYCGRIDEAHALVRSGIEFANRVDEHFFDAELKRLAADIDKMKGASTQSVEASLRSAIEIAREQGAGWFELRASTSIARLLLEQGDTAGAREQLEPLCERFREGTDLEAQVLARRTLEACR